MKKPIRMMFGFVLACLALTAHAAKEVTYYLTNPQGTPLATTDANGTITGYFDQTGYGREAMDTSTAIGFTGHVPDPDTALVYMQQRYYDPEIGRFLSVDPVKPSGIDASNVGRYGYAGNNPYRFTDPDGRAFGEATAAGCALTVEIGCAPGAAVGLLVDVTIIAAAIAIPIILNQDQAPTATPEKDSKQGSPPLPGGLVGEQDGKTGQQGKRINSGPLDPAHGGSGDSAKDFDTLTGGASAPASTEKGYPSGTMVGENGISHRPATDSSGPRIDIPANGNKPPETLHYPLPDVSPP